MVLRFTCNKLLETSLSFLFVQPMLLLAKENIAIIGGVELCMKEACKNVWGFQKVTCDNEECRRLLDSKVR